MRRLPKLETLYLSRNPLGDEGIAALISPPTSGLAKLRGLYLNGTQLSDAGCATLASALLDSGTLPALEDLDSYVTTRASAAARAAVTLSLKLARARAGVPSYLLR